jgi:hypothetical protein
MLSLILSYKITIFDFLCNHHAGEIPESVQPGIHSFSKTHLSIAENYLYTADLRIVILHSPAGYGRPSVEDYPEFFLSFFQGLIEYPDYIAENQNISLTSIINNQ